MTIFDELREKLKAFYAQYDIYILPVLKFALAMIVFIGINNMLGYLPALNSLPVVAVLSLLSAFLPLNGMTVISIFLIVLHCFGAGIGVGAFALILYLVMALLYFRFVPGDAPALLLTPLAFSLHIPSAVPLALGLLRGPLSAVSAALSVISWYFIRMVGSMNSAGTLDGSPLEVLQTMGSGLAENQELFLAAIVGAIVVLVVSTIRKLCSTFSWEIAIGAGSAVYLLVTILGSVFVRIDIDILPLVAGVLGAAVISLILEFFVYRVDYAGSQYLQFEDDEYYYYVKAIPKVASRSAGRRRSQSRRMEEQPLFEPEEADGEGFGRENLAKDMADIPDAQENSAEKFQNIDFESKLEESLKDL